MTRIARLLTVLSLVFLGSIAMARPDGPAPGTPQEINALAAAIRSLGPEVDPKEAMRAAKVTYDYTYQLSQEYQITDGPLIHNTKVNMGTRPRGLCWHWAQDIETRLKAENFKTLDMHRAVANSFNIRLEHSTAIISRKGDGFQQGIVLDPWRKGGVLFWSRTLEDRRYTWMPRAEVMARKRSESRRRISRAGNKRSGQLQDGHK
ncbi:MULTISPECIES: hypothetical protein [unclassified Roseovarius]|uniref:hypothetical protein n=1 Tax=unclassified Roseovarius TaxID=2614913 RepID=UPI00273E116E|nr:MULTISPECIES: hypothetical protein [unclassified Roseovarius]